MKESVKVSALIPAYNAEQYIDQRLDSVMNPTLREIEILVVDETDVDAPAISLLDEILDLLMQVACHDTEFADACLDECIHRALQERAFAHLEEAFRRVKCERTES